MNPWIQKEPNPWGASCPFELPDEESVYFTAHLSPAQTSTPCLLCPLVQKSSLPAHGKGAGFPDDLVNIY